MAVHEIRVDWNKTLLDEPDTGHNRWHPDIPPVVRCEPGDEVVLETRDAFDGQMGPDATLETVAAPNLDVVHPLTGPVHVEERSRETCSRWRSSTSSRIATATRCRCCPVSASSATCTRSRSRSTGTSPTAGRPRPTCPASASLALRSWAPSVSPLGTICSPRPHGVSSVAGSRRLRAAAVDRLIRS